jgi:hypothetical protein
MQVQRKALVIAICAGLLLYLIFAQAARLSTTPMQAAPSPCRWPSLSTSSTNSRCKSDPSRRSSRCSA